MARLSAYNKLGQHLGTETLTTSLTQYLVDNVPAFTDCHRDPYSATLNGAPWPYADHDRALDERDTVELTIEPHDPTSALYVITLILVSYSFYVASNLPQNYQDSTPDGQSIYIAQTHANTVQPNGVIREVAGNVPIYPDLICPPARRYVDHEEFLYLNLCVGVGQFDLALANLYIAQTPMEKYSEFIDLQISDPGANVSGHVAHENWYQSMEVAGLELATAGDPESMAATGDWSVTTTTTTFTSYLDAVLVAFPFAVDQIFRLYLGSNAGYYRVDSVSGTDNSVASVTEQIPEYDYDPSSRKLTVVGFSDAASTSLTVVTDENAIWAAVVGEVNWMGPFEVLPISETTSTLEIDVNFAQGLAEINNDGDLITREVEICIEWREVDTTTWNTVTGTTYSDNTLDERGYTVTVALGSAIRPELRFRRMTDDANDTQIVDKVNIKRVRAQLSAPTSYPDVTTMQLKIRGSNTLASTAENQINVRGAVRQLPTLANLQDHIDNAAALVLSPTRSIVRFVAWTLYQAGTSALDWAAMSAMDTVLEARGDQLDAEFVDQTTLWEAIKIMFAPGYCEPTIKEGLLAPVRIAASTDYNYIYTPDTLLGDGVTRIDTHYNESEAKGVVVEYLNATSGTMDTVQAFLPGDTEFNAKRIQAIGITDRTRAWRYGMRDRRRLALKPATYTFSTELDALNSDYGSFDALVSPLEANQSFFMTGQSGPVIYLDGDAAVDDTGDFKAVFKTPTGHLSGVYTVHSAPNDNITLVSPAALDFTPVYDGTMEATTVAIGTLDELLQRVIIRAIDPAGTDTVNVTAEEYLGDIFTDDDNAPA